MKYIIFDSEFKAYRKNGLRQGYIFLQKVMDFIFERLKRFVRDG